MANSFYATTVLADSPRAYWTMPENGGSNILVANRGVAGAAADLFCQSTTPTPGPVPGTFGATVTSSIGSFVGNSAKPLASAANSVSVECWLKFSIADMPAGGRFYFHLAVAGANTVSCGVTDASFGITITNTGINFLTFDPTPIGDNAWHYVVITWDTTLDSSELFVDAVSKEIKALVSSTVSSTLGAVVLGEEQDAAWTAGGGFDATQGWIGSIAEVALYNAVLTQTQIDAHFLARTKNPDLTSIAVPAWEALRAAAPSNDLTTAIAKSLAANRTEAAAISGLADLNTAILVALNSP